MVAARVKFHGFAMCKYVVPKSNSLDLAPKDSFSKLTFDWKVAKQLDDASRGR